MQGVNIKQTKLFMQAIAENKFGYLTLDEHKKLDDVLAQAKSSELYNAVGKDIETKANELVESDCKPEWDRIIEEMRPLGEKANELEKEKAAVPEDWTWPEEKEKELADLNAKIAELSNEYQKVTDEANKKLNAYKEERINQEQGACFLVDDEIYDFVDKLVGWKVFEKPIEK